MNDELLYIESDEEITAIIDRLHGAESASVRLVIPKGALVLQSLVSLKLLKREADKLHKEIALVSQDPIGLHLGEQADITVFAKAKDREPVFHTRGTAPTAREVFQREPTDQDEADGAASELTEADDSAPEADDVPSGIKVHYYEEEPGLASPPRTTSHDDVSEDEPPPPRHPPVEHLLRSRRRVSGGALKPFLISLLALALIAATGYVLFIEFAPRATVAVAFATEPLDQTVNVTASSGATTVDKDQGMIPAQSVEASIQLEKSAPTTGKKDIGAKATATLNLFNYWDATPQVLPTGTQFKASDGTTFISTAAATIPGAQTTLTQGKVVTTPGKTTVAIAASSNGPAANGKSGTFTIPSIPTVRQDKIYGEAAAATAGGVSKQVTVVSQADIDALKKTMADAVKGEARTQLEQKAADTRVLEDAIQLKDQTDEFSAKLDEETDTLSLTSKAIATGLAFKDADLNQAAVAKLSQSVPSARMLVLRDSDTVTVTASKLDLAAGTVAIDAHFVTRTALSVDNSALVDQVTGQSLAAASQQLRQAPGVTDVTITTRPSWLKTMPRRSGQVTLVVSYQ